jgi:hypothetical protein
MALSVGQRVTLLRIDDCMALTHRYEFQVREALEPTRVGYQERKLRSAIVRQRGKRKDVYLDLEWDDILLDGWDVPFKADTECAGVWSGNVCYNLVGDPDVIRRHIKEKAVYPVHEQAKAKILVSRAPRTTCDDSETELLYPEIEAHHAVVDRMKEAII